MQHRAPFTMLLMMNTLLGSAHAQVAAADHGYSWSTITAAGNRPANQDEAPSFSSPATRCMSAR